MATKKKVEAPKPVPVLEEALFSEIDGLCAVAKKLIVREEDGSLEIPADKLGTAVDVLSLTRALATKADAESKVELVKIMEPVAERVKQLGADKKSIIGRAQEIEADVVKGLQDLLATGVLTPEGAESKAGCKLTLIGKDSLVIDDLTAVPDEYLLPREQCIDRAKIAAVLAAEAAYVAALPKDSPHPVTTVPFAHLTKVYSFRTKVPEEVA